MKPEEAALVLYRLNQADESLQEAATLLREGMSPRSVMNRLYYAMFYAVLAVLQERQLGTSKHSGAIALFDREFVKTNVFNKEMSKALHRVFELRQKGDYLEKAEVTKEDVTEVMNLAQSFVRNIRSYLES